MDWPTASALLSIPGAVTGGLGGKAALARKRVLVASLLAGGGTALVALRLRRQLRLMQREQAVLVAAALPPKVPTVAAAAAAAAAASAAAGEGAAAPSDGGHGAARVVGVTGGDGGEGADGKAVAAAAGGLVPRRRRAGVDHRFWDRLAAILRVCIPSAMSPEAGMVAVQAGLLLCRSLLSDRIVALEGACAEAVTATQWAKFVRVCTAFALTAVPTAVVNAGLKAMQVLISLSFRRRLTLHLHRAYLAHRAYYTASVLGGLEHADQRITDDVDKFCDAVSELFSYTFKPLFDVILFSRSLGRLIGYRGQAALYAYFLCTSSLLRRLSPPLATMTAQSAALSGDFRAAHSRLAARAEEVAFHDPPGGRAERQALDMRLTRLLRHSKLAAVQRFVQQCLDGYCVKYTASVIGLTIFAVPLYLTPESERPPQEVLAGRYVSAMRLMMNTSTSMGQLVLVYKRLHVLAGHVSRVSELLEQIRLLSRPRGQLAAFQRLQRATGAGDAPFRIIADDGSIVEPAVRGVVKGAAAVAAVDGAIVPVVSNGTPAVEDVLPPPRQVYGDHIALNRVTLWSPDGTALARELTFTVTPDQSVIVLGPNGCGKSTLLRLLAGLWPLQAGTLTLPSRDDVFFLSQRPYVVTGGSLRAQLQYPHLPGVVVGDTRTHPDARATRCLETVELGYLVERAGGLDGLLAWEEVLSGGEKQRLAVARLLYHGPRYAVVDEATSAISADGEVLVYRALRDAGVTLLSVAHRQAVIPFHEHSVVFDGAGGWALQSLTAAVSSKVGGEGAAEEGSSEDGVCTGEMNGGDA